MTDLVIFNILIPLTNHFTGALHLPTKFQRWVATNLLSIRNIASIGSPRPRSRGRRKLG